MVDSTHPSCSSACNQHKSTTRQKKLHYIFNSDVASRPQTRINKGFLLFARLQSVEDGSKGLVHTTSHQKLEYFLRNGEIKTLLSEAIQFLGNDKTTDFPLGIRGKRFEHDFLVEASDEFRTEHPVEFRESSRSSVANGRRVGRKSCCEPILLMQTI